MGLFSSIILYKYNDMSALFVRALAYYTGQDYLQAVNTNPLDSRIDILNNFLNTALFRIFDPILTANLLAVVYFILALLFSYLLFKSLVSSKVTGMVFALFYSTSIYFVYRVISFTPNLYSIYIFPLVIYLIQVKKVKPYMIGILLALFFALSSYYAYFAVILVVLWYLSTLVLSEGPLLTRIRAFIKNLVLLSIPVALFLGIFYLSLLAKHFPAFNTFNDQSSENSNTPTSIRYRPMEDYYNLSFRPWYFFIPPKNSIFFGTLSRNIYKTIADSTYYLADDYTEEESAGSFIGWHFAFGTTAVIYFILRKKQYQNVRALAVFYSNTEVVKRSLLLILGILLLSHPPSITIYGVTFYTPSYLLYFAAPVFRTLVRFSIIIYLLVLMLNSMLFYSLYVVLPTKLQKALAHILLICISFIMFAIKLPVVNMNHPPEEIAFLATIGNASDNYLVYPKGDYYSIFWTIYHHKNLVNPQGYTLLDSNDPAELLTFVPEKSEFLQKMKSYDIKYVVYYQNEMREEVQRATANAYFTTVFGAPVYNTSEIAIYEVD